MSKSRPQSRWRIVQAPKHRHQVSFFILLGILPSLQVS